MRYTYRVNAEGSAPTGRLGYTAYCCPYPVGGELARTRAGSVLYGHAEYDLIMAGLPENGTLGFPGPFPASNIYSQASVTCVAVASLVDGQSFTLDNGERSATFEFDVAGNGVNVNAIAVDVSLLTTAAEVAAACIAAINTSAPWLGVAAQSAPDATFYVQNRLPGARGEAGLNSETVLDAGFQVTQFGNSRDVVALLWGPKRAFQYIGPGIIEDGGGGPG